MKEEVKPELVYVGDDCLWHSLKVRVHSTYSDQTCDVVTVSGDFMPDIQQRDLKVIA